jgi:glycosyltransferase involved in cell wall biosynthesis
LQQLNIAILSYRSAQFGGGQGVYVKDISYNLNQMGHKVDVISGPPYPNLDSRINLIKLPGLNLFETFYFKDRLYKFFRKKNKTLNDWYEYDIIIDNQSLSYGMLEIQKRFPLIEIIHHPITYDFKYELAASKKIKYKISRYRWYSFLKMQKKVAPKLKSIISPSKSSKNGIIQEFNCKEETINIINNGLDANEFIPIKEIKRIPFRLITTASADVPLKGLDYSLKALEILKKEFPKIHLVVIGAPKKNGHTERLIKKLKIKEIITFKSNLTKREISEEYSKSSISIVSSLYEGFGYPVIEAMSCGTPLIATNISSIPELVGGYATLIDPKNHEALAGSIRKILSDYERFQEIAVRGREHIIKTFNWDKITKEYESIILKTIEDFKNADI